MAEKTELYPKTERFSLDKVSFYITEKLDGSNAVIFKYEDVLYFATRKNIFSLDELLDKKCGYKGSYKFFKKYGEKLQNELHNDSALCGEWLGMGKLKYPDLPRFNIFAKANIVKDETGFHLTRKSHNHELFIYPFQDLLVPDYLGIVPEIARTEFCDYEFLDNLYDAYCKRVDRNVEGFVISFNDSILKYVRHKNGKLLPIHYESPSNPNASDLARLKAVEQ